MNLIPCSEEEYYYKLDNIVLGSCNHLRSVFKARWNLETGEDWRDDPESLKRFITGLGKSLFKKAAAHEKNTLKTKCVEEWDMALLCMVLQKFGPEEKYKTDNSAISKLKTMRNFLAHHPNKKVPKEEYEENVKIVRCSLLDLGMGEKDVASLIEMAGLTSYLQALELFNELKKKAEDFRYDGNVHAAIDCYSEAIDVPSLLPENVAQAFLKRAECFLILAKEPNSNPENCNHAIMDISNALELNESSWMAHYLSAQCHQFKNDLDNAIYHYDRALSISPGRIQVRNDLDACKLLAGNQERLDHLNPLLMPLNLQERIAHFEKETGIKMSEKSFDEFEYYADLFVQGQDHVVRGHKYFSGWNAPQNFTEAAKHFEKAAHAKNAEGMYNLAMCYQFGNGVKQNVELALSMYHEIAEMDPNTPGEVTTLGCNAGVAGAQHSIGLLYDYGIAVEQDPAEAAKWYRRAMGNGVGHAANNLAILYSQGNGIPRDMKMAALCWTEAVRLKDHNAAASLVRYYLDEMEPEKAVHMAGIGRAMGNSGLLQFPEAELNKLVDPVKSMRGKAESYVIEFEKANNLQTKGFTFRERLTRTAGSMCPSMEKVANIVEKSSTKYIHDSESWGGKAQMYMTKEMIVSIQNRARHGSVTASGVMETLAYSMLLNWLLECGSYKTKGQQMEIVNSLYNCAIRQRHLLSVSGWSGKELKSLLGTLFEESCETKGDDDMKVRFCYVKINLSGSIQSEDMYAVELLKEGIKRYPDNLHYYEYLTNILTYKQKYKEGIFYAEQGLKMFPHNPDLLYPLAVNLRLETSRTIREPKCETAYKEFLKYAPEDHRKVPEAFYQLSFLPLQYIMRVDPVMIANNKEMDTVTSYLRRGQEAERQQLPCYIPYEESDVKSLVENFLTLTNFVNKNEMPSNSNTQSNSPMKVMERKPYLKSPTRKGAVLRHRKHPKATNENEPALKKRRDILFMTSKIPKLRQTMVKKISVFRDITLQEMNPNEDHIFNNSILDLTIIDDLTAYYTSVHLIAEDCNGDVTRLYIYNANMNKEALDNFRAGCRVAIINPYMTIGARDFANGIRVDDPRCIVYLKKIENMCRFCGDEGASGNCSLCKRPYCSRKCQMLDWKEFNHQLVCPLEY